MRCCGLQFWVCGMRCAVSGVRCGCICVFVVVCVCCCFYTGKCVFLLTLMPIENTGIMRMESLV